MKRISIVFLVIALVAGLGVSTSFAETYVSGNFGAVVISNSDISVGASTGEFDFDIGFGLTGALGRTLENSGRVEIELGYRANDLNEITIDGLETAEINGDIATLSLMANGYYDFAESDDFTPFIGVGIGFANIKADTDLAGSEDDTVFAYQLALGGSLSVHENLDLDLQYRFFGTTDPEFDGIEAEYITHNLMVGLRHSF